MLKYEIKLMSDEIARRLIAGFPRKLREAELARYEQDPAMWLREKGLPMFGFNLYYYPDAITSNYLGNFETHREAVEAIREQA